MRTRAMDRLHWQRSMWDLVGPKERVLAQITSYRKNAPREGDGVLESWRRRNITSLKIVLMLQMFQLVFNQFIRLPLRKPKAHWQFQQ